MEWDFLVSFPEIGNQWTRKNNAGGSLHYLFAV